MGSGWMHLFPEFSEGGKGEKNGVNLSAETSSQIQNPVCAGSLQCSSLHSSNGVAKTAAEGF